MKLYYLAHPYTGNEKENFKLATSRTQTLLDLGYHVLSPVTYTHPIHQQKERDYNFWMKFCLVLISKCDGIIFAPGWEDSRGCLLEYAHSDGKEILFLEDII